MDKVMKFFVDGEMNKDIENFLRNHSNNQGINLSKLYFGHVSFVGKSSNNLGDEYRILIDSSIKTPHNRFFVDIINKESFGIFGGFTGITNIDNTGACVDEFILLSDKIDKKRMTIEEIRIFISQFNDKSINEEKTFNK